MNVAPIANLSFLNDFRTPSQPAQPLTILASPARVLPPASADGPGLPPDNESVFRGIYDANGLLPRIKQAGLGFLAHA